MTDFILYADDRNSKLKIHLKYYLRLTYCTALQLQIQNYQYGKRRSYNNR